MPRVDCLSSEYLQMTTRNGIGAWSDWGSTLGTYGQRKVTFLGHKNSFSYLSLLLHCFYVLWVTRCHQLLGPSFLPLQIPCHIDCCTGFCGCGVYENGNKNKVQDAARCFVVRYYRSPSTSPTFRFNIKLPVRAISEGLFKISVIVLLLLEGHCHFLSFNRGDNGVADKKPTSPPAPLLMEILIKRTSSWLEKQIESLGTTGNMVL